MKSDGVFTRGENIAEVEVARVDSNTLNTDVALLIL